MGKKNLMTLFACTTLFVLVGCSTPAVITLKDGEQIETKDKPRYDEDSGFYQFEQEDGKPVQVNKDEIHTIKIK
ncbi:YgdI/YgdR family lipoprotein [Denitrificimonas sp. JX-1]|uniref:YgdI/YgdR family lipoprotein n=1 Tax=Denitrificimonas halotolerans TaxID=3098930 RepID=A0ABU5GXV1_9GAMM|nr:YgdI/YgdR family lipoprotein [Denitrificimonas sp. JX-1]MDY7220468.1 YgdI/YgdR family lipoprotein [Denitrificimonas sp. JX-1]